MSELFKKRLLKEHLSRVICGKIENNKLIEYDCKKNDHKKNNDYILPTNNSLNTCFKHTNSSESSGDFIKIKPIRSNKNGTNSYQIENCVLETFNNNNNKNNQIENIYNKIINNLY